MSAISRRLGYLWALPVTVAGLLFAGMVAVTGGMVRVHDGVVEVTGGLFGRLLRGGRLFAGGAAMTLGHVILARDAECLARSRKHEMFHVQQFERWGVFLIPTYWALAVWLWCRGYHPYLDHPLEPPPK